MVALILLLTACEPAAPQRLHEVGEAIVAWEQAEALLAEGKPEEARAALAVARSRRPGDALLEAWSAHAAAAAGDLDAALAHADAAVTRSKGEGLYRWQRATLRARARRVDEAAADVRAALSAGAVTPRAVLRDPDLAPLAEHPALDFLPDAPLEAKLTVPSGLSFLGSEVEVSLEVVGVGSGPLEVGGGVAGPVELVRVTEAASQDTLGDGVRTLRWTLRVAGAGTVGVGPLEVRQGPWTTSVALVPFETGAPPAAEPAPTQRLPLPSLSSLVGTRVPPTVFVVDDAAWALTPAGARVRCTPDCPSLLPWRLDAADGDGVELRRLPAQSERVTLAVGGDVVWDGPVPASR